MSFRADILKAYNTSLAKRLDEAKEVKKGSTVEDLGGNRYEVVQVSNIFDDIKEFDVSNEAKAWVKRIEAEGKDPKGYTWMAVKDHLGRTAVYFYGTDGLTLVESAKQVKELEYVKEKVSVVGAYDQIINEDKKQDAILEEAYKKLGGTVKKVLHPKIDPREEMVKKNLTGKANKKKLKKVLKKKKK
jgi:hypothetical protein